ALGLFSAPPRSFSRRAPRRKFPATPLELPLPIRMRNAGTKYGLDLTFGRPEGCGGLSEDARRFRWWGPGHQVGNVTALRPRCRSLPAATQGGRGRDGDGVGGGGRAPRPSGCGKAPARL